MEKSYVWYPTYKQLPSNNRMVIIQCKNLDEPTIGYFDNATRKWTITDLELSKEIEESTNVLVVAWMEMPPKYVDDRTYEFRSAAETRYFMSISASRDEDVDIANFCTIRNAIYYAAQKGFNSCEVPMINISDELERKLKNGGYTVKKNKDVCIISWI